jgi:hypothetical protein
MSTSTSDEKLINEIREKVAKQNKSNVEARPQSVRSLDMRNPEEVKDYLENLYVEYSFQCFKEKQPDGCHRLANFLENIRSEYKNATELYKKNCDEYKYPRSCLTYSKNKSLGRGKTFFFFLLLHKLEIFLNILNLRMQGRPFRSM